MVLLACYHHFKLLGKFEITQIVSNEALMQLLHQKVEIANYHDDELHRHVLQGHLPMQHQLTLEMERLLVLSSVIPITKCIVSSNGNLTEKIFATTIEICHSRSSLQVSFLSAMLIMIIFVISLQLSQSCVLLDKI